MFKKFLFALMGLGLVVGDAQAEPVSFEFTATVTQAFDYVGGGAPVLGSTVAGRYTFDSALVDEDSDPEVGVYLPGVSTPAKAVMKLADGTVVSSHPDPARHSMTITVENSNPDAYRVSSSFLPGSTFESRLEMHLEMEGASLVTDDDLLLTPPLLAGSDFSRVRFFSSACDAHACSPDWEAYADLTTFSLKTLPNVIDVTTTTDVMDELDGLASLREAIDRINGALFEDDFVINLQPGATYPLTITGTGSDDMSNNSGSLTVHRGSLNLTINGFGARIDGSALAGPQRLLRIRNQTQASVNITLNDLVLAGKSLTTGQGGAAVNASGLGPNDVLTFNRCYVHSNSSYAEGGAMEVTGFETVNINDSAFVNNSAQTGGMMFVTNLDTLNINNSTVSGNLAASGGVLYGSAVAIKLRSSTVYNNSASNPTGGGGFNIVASTLDMKNSILSGNSGGNCVNPAPVANTVTSQGYNVLGDLSAECALSGGPQAGDQTGINDPLLEPLAVNGGMTPTHALLADSPALDNGDPNGCTDTGGNALAFDQRGSGFPRVQDGDVDGSAICDSGAYEKTGTIVVIEDTLEDLSDLITGLDPSFFTGKNRQAALLNQINAALSDLAVIQAAADPAPLIAALKGKLNSIGAKADGCLNPNDHTQDWITDCTVQAQIQELIQDILALLDTL